MMTKFKGVMNVLVTPFKNVNGQTEVDYESLKKLVRYQLDQKINGLVVNGTTAESPTLKKSEVEKIFTLVRAEVGLGLPLVLGTGSNCTDKTIENTQLAEKLGADAALVVVPYYNKPPQRGLIQHFKTVASSTKLPLFLYNVPGRTVASMNAETILQLSQIQNIIGIKEASGNLDFFKQLKLKIKSNFIFLSGDDQTYIEFLALGGDGIMSVMSNLIAGKCLDWTELVATGKLSDARNSFQSYKKLIDLMYIEANPIPIKWMLQQQNIISSSELRLPLCELDEQFHQEIKSEMKKLGIL